MDSAAPKLPLEVMLAATIVWPWSFLLGRRAAGGLAGGTSTVAGLSAGELHRNSSSEAATGPNAWTASTIAAATSTGVS